MSTSILSTIAEYISEELKPVFKKHGYKSIECRRAAYQACYLYTFKKYDNKHIYEDNIVIYLINELGRVRGDSQLGTIGVSFDIMNPATDFKKQIDRLKSELLEFAEHL